MSQRLSQSVLESYLCGAATLLRGLVDANDYKQYNLPADALQTPLRRLGWVRPSAMLPTIEVYG